MEQFGHIWWGTLAVELAIVLGGLLILWLTTPRRG